MTKEMILDNKYRGIRATTTGKAKSNISVIMDFIALAMFSPLFLYGENRLHRRNLMKGL